MKDVNFLEQLSDYRILKTKLFICSNSYTAYSVCYRVTHTNGLILQDT
jgi:hypothetical protein